MKNNQSFDLKLSLKGDHHFSNTPSRSSSTKVSANSAANGHTQPISIPVNLDRPEDVIRDHHSIAFLTHENLKLRQENKVLKK
jgi:hypothetical protein